MYLLTYRFSLYLCCSWLELIALSFSRAQFWAQLGYFNGISERFLERVCARKSLSDAGFEVVPGGGIEPSTRGFSVRSAKTRKSFKYLIYKGLAFSPTLGFFGFFRVFLGPRGQSDGQSQARVISNFLSQFEIENVFALTVIEDFFHTCCYSK